MIPAPIMSESKPPLEFGRLAAVKGKFICGTDFSEQALQAVEAAAALATRLNEPLMLVHAVDKESRTTLPEDLRESLCVYERAQLHEELERLRAAHVETIECFRTGSPQEVLLEA